MLYLSLDPGEFDEKVLNELDDRTAEKSWPARSASVGWPANQTETAATVPKASAPQQSLRDELNDDVPF